MDHLFSLARSMLLLSFALASLTVQAESVSTADNPRVQQHLNFIRTNHARLLETYRPPSATSGCASRESQFAYKSGYMQALQMTSTGEISSTDPTTPNLHPLLAAILNPENQNAFNLKETYNSVREEFDSGTPMSNAMMCFTAASMAFDLSTGAPKRPHAKLREEIKCCIEGHKAGRAEMERELAKDPSPSPLCVELYNEGVDSVKRHCANIACGQHITDPAERRRSVLAQIYAYIPNDFTDYLLNKFGYCFPQGTKKDARTRFEHMLPQLRSCFAWGRGAGIQGCANLLLQDGEAQSTAASPVNGDSGRKTAPPVSSATPPAAASSGATAK